MSGVSFSGFGDLSDGELCELIRAGNRDAEGVLVQRYDRLIWKLVKQFKVFDSVADDWHQEGMMAIMRAGRGFDPQVGVKFITYAYRAVQLRFLYLRDKALNDKSADFLSLDWEDGDGGGGGSFADMLGEGGDGEEVQASESVDRVRAAVGRLPERLRNVMLAELSGKSTEDLCGELGVSKQRISQLKAEAVAQLQVLLAEKVEAGDEKQWKRRVWTKSEIKIFRQIAESDGIIAAAKAVGRPVGGSYRKAEELGIKSGLRDDWTADEDEFLIANANRGWVWCGEQLDRSAASIRNRVRRLGIAQKKRVKFSEGELGSLLAMHRDGKSNTEIAEAMGCSDETVRKTLREHSLQSNRTNEAMRLRRIRQSLMEKAGVDHPVEARRIDICRRLGWVDSIPKVVAFVLTALDRIGRGNRDDIAWELHKIARTRGWSDVPTTWHSALTGAKWLRDRGYVVASGRSDKKLEFSLTDKVAELRIESDVKLMVV